MIDAKIIRVIDGDTVRVQLELNARLDFINTMETRGKEREEGLKAKEWLQNKVKDGDIVQIDIKKFDMYERPLIILYKDGENINGELLRKGLAEVYAPGVVNDGKLDVI